MGRIKSPEHSQDNAISSHNPTDKRRKIFSHSTRRKRLRVKELLDSEDSIDFLKLPVVDLLWLEEHKRKSLVKERKSNKNDTNNREEEPYADDEMRYGIGSSKTLFNSHSFMEKERAVRWSNEDTELFYEGVRQFGSNMTMIQQLFPGRTRHQIKNKFKKEENLRPLRLSDAVSGSSQGMCCSSYQRDIKHLFVGSPDHTYFRKVIDHLKKESSNSKNNDATDEVKISSREDIDVADDGEAEPAGEDQSFYGNGDGDCKGDGDGEAFEYTYCTDF